jgi:hypothetical protein
MPKGAHTPSWVYTGDGSRADAGTPPAASRQLPSLTHTGAHRQCGARCALCSPARHTASRCATLCASTLHSRDRSGSGGCVGSTLVWGLIKPVKERCFQFNNPL